MPLPFSHVCELLEQCSKLCAARQKHHGAVVSWFNRHRSLINAHDTSVAALLSTLLPEKRTDRVYCIQAVSLEKIIGRALRLGSSRIKELALHKIPGKGIDLADCVEHILNTTPNPEQPVHCAVTVEYIDEVLHSLASRIKWSSPKVRNAHNHMTNDSRDELERLYLRFTPVEAKWFTRLVLKSYEPLIFQSEAIYALCDPALPSTLRIVDDFVAAIDVVQRTKPNLLPNSCGKSSTGNLLATVKPQYGIKVGRQTWFKARSIKHCLDLGRGKMSVEQKIDGEYCQIHIDLANRQSPIQIFSKSGKDSTEDRKKVHSAIMDSLRNGQSGFSIEQHCILEGELVVYSDREMKIRPFHTIRNHVARRGRFMNTEQDSPPKSFEHLMIVYFDILSFDETSLLDARHSERRRHLERIIRVIPGRAEVISRQVVDFDHKLAASHLRKAFAKVIMQKGEGLVLKPDDPYFNFSPGRHRCASICIKLKKEYIGNFGEIGDFAVVGAGFDPVRAKSYNIPHLQWTHFYLGCLNNKEEVIRWAAKPDFTVVSIVEMNEAQLKCFVTHCITDSVTLAENRQTIIQLPPGLERRPPMSNAFTRPPVVDVRCFSFEIAGNIGFWTPRFPGVSKIHFDRDYTDAITFEELQALAKDAAHTPELEDSQENLQWIARLERADPRGVAVDAMSQLTASSLATSSPRQQTRSISEIGSPTSPRISRSQPAVFREAASLVNSAVLLKPSGPAATLVTPPMSSAPQEPATQNNKGTSAMKRLADANAQSPSLKRRRLSPSSSAEHAQQSTSKRQSLSRQPLACIEGNCSQRSVRTGSPDPISEQNCKVTIDLTSTPSPISSQASAGGVMGPQKHKNGCMPGQNMTGTRMPDKSGSQNMSLCPGVGLGEAGADMEAYGCKLVGSQCQFAKTTMALAPSLANNDDVACLLDEHGINRPHISLQAFTSSLRAIPQSDEQSAILLVDSIGQLQQTRDIMEELENTLDRVLVASRAWVHVYDWRVLENITKLEDRRILSKEFDGFSDPWRRWQVGIL